MPRDNLTSSGASAYAYNSENMMTSASGGVGLLYYPVGRLLQTTSSSLPGTRFGYDGSHLMAEYDTGNVLQKRYVFGPGADEALVEYDAAGNRTWLVADERGSVVARTDASGATTAINRYDEYGIPQSTNAGRFQYTGQAWLPELGMYNYKALIYSPTLGRFMQTDPIGYGDGMNWYNYTHSDPVNGIDPSGLVADIFVTGRYNCAPDEVHVKYVGCAAVGKSLNLDLPTSNMVGEPDGGGAVGDNSPLPQNVIPCIKGNCIGSVPFPVPPPCPPSPKSPCALNRYLKNNPPSPMLPKKRLRFKSPDDDFSTIVDGVGCITSSAAIETVVTAALAGVSCGLFISDFTETYKVKQ